MNKIIFFKLFTLNDVSHILKLPNTAPELFTRPQGLGKMGLNYALLQATTRCKVIDASPKKEGLWGS